MRILVLTLCLSLVLPGPGFALRPPQPELPAQRSGLEESLSGKRREFQRVLLHLERLIAERVHSRPGNGTVSPRMKEEIEEALYLLDLKSTSGISEKLQKRYLDSLVALMLLFPYGYPQYDLDGDPSSNLDGIPSNAESDLEQLLGRGRRVVEKVADSLAVQRKRFGSSLHRRGGARIVQPWRDLEDLWRAQRTARNREMTFSVFPPGNGRPLPLIVHSHERVGEAGIRFSRIAPYVGHTHSFSLPLRASPEDTGGAQDEARLGVRNFIIGFHPRSWKRTELALFGAGMGWHYIRGKPDEVDKILRQIGLLLPAGAEETQAWDSADFNRWKVYGGQAAVLLARQLGWRAGFQISGMTSAAVAESLSRNPGERLLVENRNGQFRLIDASIGPLFQRLQARSLSEILIEPLTPDLIDREKGQVLALLKQMDLVGRLESAQRLKVPSTQANFGFAASDPRNGQWAGFISASRGDALSEDLRSDTVYIAYNVVEKSRRGEGIGRLLFESVAAAAAAANPPVKRILWESLTDRAARQFYRRMGGREDWSLPSAVAARLANRVAFALELPSSAGAEEAQEFESLERFMDRYADVLATRNLTGWVKALKERGLPTKVWVLPVPAGAAPGQVTAYVTAEAPGEQDEWELAAAERLNREKDRLKETFFDVKRLEYDSKFEKTSVVIRQTGGIKPLGSHPPVITLSILPDVEELRPSWVYAVAVNEALWGRELGPVLGVLTFQDEAGRWVHAIFA